MNKGSLSVFSAAVIVSALGYFVDVYDMLLFSVVRAASLTDLGLSGDALTHAGLFLMNMQMGGMLLGGLFWGVLGDKKGRLKVLFGSIFLYSLANLANAFVHDVNTYAVCRFIAGIGLAGELGAGITLVVEGLPKQLRGLGTTLVATVGVSGAIVASLVGGLVEWRTAYIIAGFIGLILLVLRVSVFESKLFHKAERKAHLKRGSFVALFTTLDRFKRYSVCLLMGIPVWFIVGIIVTLSPEIGQHMGIAEPIKASSAVIAYSVMITIGDLVSGLLSQLLQSRKKVLVIFACILAVILTLFFIHPPLTPQQYYLYCGAMGFFIGTWVILVTTASEMFGTNLRATVTSTVPNFVRGSTVLMNLSIAAMTSLGFLTAVQIVAAVVIILAIGAALSIPETFHKDMDFYEEV